MYIRCACIVMHMARRGSRSPARAGTPAASCCGCCSPTPRSRSARSPARSNAGQPLGVLQPHLVPLADRVLEETNARDARRPRRRLPGAAARPVRRDRRAARRRRRRDRLRRRLPARRPGAVGAVLRRRRTPAPGPTACPSCPASASSCAARRRIAVPGCYPTVSTLALAPAVAAGLVEPDVVVVAASGTSGAGKAAKPHLLGSEVMGNASAYGVGGAHRHTPEIIQNLSGLDRRRRCGSASRRCWCRCRAASSPPAPRRSPAPRPPTRCARPTRRRTPTSRSCTCCPEGQWPQTKSVTGSNAVHLQVTVDEAAGRLVAVGAVDNLAKGTAGAAVQCMNLALGLDEDHRASPPWDSPREARAPSSAVPRDASPSSGSARAPRCPPGPSPSSLLLGHRHRHRDLDRLRRPQRAEQGRRTSGRSRPSRSRARSTSRSPASSPSCWRRSPRRRSASSRSRRSTPTGSWSRGDEADAGRRGVATTPGTTVARRRPCQAATRERSAR